VKDDIRRLTAADYDAVLALWQRSGLSSVRPQGRDSREAFAKQLKQGQLVLGLKETGKLIGCVVATNDARKGWINRLVVDPDHRRQGHARRLIKAAEDALRQQGLTLIAAQIEDWNEASLALFESEGYRVHRDVVYVSKRESDEA
jgi:ribosomal protein S18 acetylase RimI-like enzyme